jgi:hypothetical protein
MLSAMTLGMSLERETIVFKAMLGGSRKAEAVFTRICNRGNTLSNAAVSALKHV